MQEFMIYNNLKKKKFLTLRRLQICRKASNLFLISQNLYVSLL